MKKYFLIVIIFLILSGCVFKEAKNQTSYTPAAQDNNLEEAADTVKINNQEIKVEIADTLEKQYQGLSFRKELCADCGMLFEFKDKRIKTFVMREMKFPLDIIWIDDNIIIGINKNLLPEGADYKNFYPSPAPVDYVLEVNAGFADENNIKVGDKIIYESI